MHRTLESRGFISAILAMASGAFLFYTRPFPDQHDLSACHCDACAARLPELQVHLLHAALHHTVPDLLSPPLRALHLHA